MFYLINVLIIMSIEREWKIIWVNKQQLIQTIELNGWTKTFEGIVSGEYYKCWNQKIRVRNEKRWLVVCLKKKVEEKSNVKIREEIEIVVDSKENLLLIFKELWITETKKVSKYRTSYSFWKCHLDIDEYEWIPTILEIEGETDEEIIEVASLLWYKKEEIKDYSFSDIEKKYLTKKNT